MTSFAFKPDARTGFMLARSYPPEWPSTRLRFLCSFNPTKKQLAHLDPSTPVSFVPMEKVSEDGVMDLGDSRPIESVANGYTFFADGDVLVAKITPCFENGKGAECKRLTNGFGFGTTEFHVLRSKYLDSRFLYYITASDPFRTIGATEMSGAAGQKRIPESFLQNLITPVPPVPTQRRIAAFLDQETARIDALVAEKETLLGLLEEKRASLISQAVTRGLDPRAKLKPSGIPWLGEVPEHWKPKELRYLVDPKRQIMYGIVLPGPHVEDGVPIIKGGDVRPHRLNPATLSRTTHEIALRHARSMVRSGDIVFSIRGSIGDVAFVPDSLDGANLTQDAARIAARSDVDRDWLFWALQSSYTYSSLEVGSLGAAVRGINIRDLKRLWLALPPLAEQRAIGAFLTTQMRNLIGLEAEIQTSISLLREKRSSLISSAVTGEMEVP